MPLVIVRASSFLGEEESSFDDDLLSHAIGQAAPVIDLMLQPPFFSEAVTPNDPSAAARFLAMLGRPTT